jgi:gliding motility-associated-like protein
VSCFGQETVYIPPGSVIQFGSTVPAGLFGYLINEGNLSIKKRGNVFFSGKIWANRPGSYLSDDNLDSNSVNGGTVHFVSNPLGQQIVESNSLGNKSVFCNLTIDNNAGVILVSDITVLNNLLFKRGHLLLNNHNLIMGDEMLNGNISGYDESRFIVTGDGPKGGFIRQRSIMPGALVSFPAGPSTSVYSPAEVINNGIENDFYARVFNNVYEKAVAGAILTDSILGQTWEIAKKSGGNEEVIVRLQNDGKIENNIFRSMRMNSYITLYSNNQWDKPFLWNFAQSPGNITNSFPIVSAIVNSRRVVLGSNITFLSKRVSNHFIAFPIPNAFSPNGDNINDKWIIKGLKDYDNCTVEIFTRYGREIFRSTGYHQPWDGNYNGSQMPVGTYYYLIDLRNGERPLTGPLTLLR